MNLPTSTEKNNYQNQLDNKDTVIIHKISAVSQFLAPKSPILWEINEIIFGLIQKVCIMAHKKLLKAYSVKDFIEPAILRITKTSDVLLNINLRAPAWDESFPYILIITYSPSSPAC